jgi:hypothetical protein
MMTPLTFSEIKTIEGRLLDQADRAVTENDFEKANRFIDRYMTFSERIAARHRRFPARTAFQKSNPRSSYFP